MPQFATIDEWLDYPASLTPEEEFSQLSPERQEEVWEKMSDLEAGAQTDDLLQKRIDEENQKWESIFGEDHLLVVRAESVQAESNARAERMKTLQGSSHVDDEHFQKGKFKYR